MKLNQRKSIHIMADHKSITVEYLFTMDDVNGLEPGARKVWAIIKFKNPETKHYERLRVAEPQSILEASENEIREFVEKEVECFFKHCDEEVRS